MSLPVRVSEHPLNRHIYVVELEDGSSKLATLNMVPGKRVYGEKLYNIAGNEYREWVPYRSKLAAAILRGIRSVPLREGDKVLYLGAAAGTTVSHVSDVVGKSGRVYGVEFAPRVMRDFLLVVRDRSNVLPIFADARKPWEYAHLLELVDVLYVDVAQPEQASLTADNAHHFLKPGGKLFFAIKARSIDVTQEPTEVYKREIDTLKRGGFEIIDVVHLEPYDKDHAMVLAEYRG
ncbi:MAG: fibrillarin-like rRNA/tRNA 2'-O-methyltransferase [Fervidicoccaceae archaeon]